METNKKNIWVFWVVFLFVVVCCVLFLLLVEVFFGRKRTCWEYRQPILSLIRVGDSWWLV